MRTIISVIGFVALVLGTTQLATAGIWTTLDMPGAFQTGAYGIDGSNIVGEYYGASGYHGFLYDGSNWTTLDMPGATRTQAFGIDGGNIVGNYYDASGHSQGFLYDGSTWTALDMPGASETSAYGISGNNIVGRYWDASGYHGFLYDGSTWTTLNAPRTHYGTTAYGIDGSNIVGCSSVHGFLYNMTSLTWTTLDMPGRNDIVAHGISGSNIVGYYSDIIMEHHSFLYDGSTWTTLDMPGAHYDTTACGIDGSHIVGCYDDAHGFIYTIPEPATLAIFGFALPFFRNFSRRKTKGLR